MAQLYSFESAIKYLQDVGAYDYLLPFLLIFAITFAVLEKIQIFGEGKTRINALISMVIGLVLIANQNIVGIIQEFLPRVSLIIVVILMFLMVVFMFTGDKFKGFEPGIMGFVFIIAIIAIGLALSPNFGLDTARWLTNRDRQRLIGLGLLILIPLILYWFVTADDPKEDNTMKSLGKALEGIGNQFK